MTSDIPHSNEITLFPFLLVTENENDRHFGNYVKQLRILATSRKYGVAIFYI